jgi:hypothetical protein
MKFRLDTQHYINDRLLEPGHIIGDETDVPMVLPNGDPLKPSVNMTPLDDEAWSFFRETFPGVRRPDRDPTKAIPLRGTGDAAKAPPLFHKNPDTGMVLQPSDLVHGQPAGEPQYLEVGKKGLPDQGSPNHPVGQPVIGHAPTTPTPVVPPKPVDPAFANHPSQAEPTQAQKDAAALADQQTKAEANRKATAEAAKPTTEKK